MKAPRTIAIAVNQAKPGARRCRKELAAWLQREGVRVVPTNRRADMIVALGGDGTMLRVARELDGNPTPILGVNLGGLGFLTSVRSDELFPVIKQVLAGKYSVTTRHTLRATILRDGKRRHTHHALNDAVIARGATSRVVGLSLAVDGEWLTEYTCDGIILATATGSTAYSLSAGGPILLPAASAYVMTPICPHALTNRSIIINAESVVRCRVTRGTGQLVLTVDGQVEDRLRVGDEVEVRGGRHAVRLVTPPGHANFEVLRQKLKWSGSNV
jgi:NAD+ kinase